MPQLRHEGTYAYALRQRRSPHQVRHQSGDFRPTRDKITVMAMHANKGLESPLVAILEVGQTPSGTTDEHEAARLSNVAATRSTQWSVITVGEEGEFGWMLAGNRIDDCSRFS